jgi:cobalt-zinc-cadmium efflux system outer membrane protein
MRLPPVSALFSLVLLCPLSVGCAQPPRDRAWVEEDIAKRLGTPNQGDSERTLEQLAQDGLDENEAVELALSGSPRFAADMAQLMRATADFREAARIQNPRVSYLAPIGTINAAATVLVPVMDAFRLPKRTKMAARNLESITESLVQSGLDLARDVRLAHVDCLLAADQEKILGELAKTAGEFADLADRRAVAGDVSPADALAIRSDAFVVQEEEAAARRARVVQEARLRLLLGVTHLTEFSLVRTTNIDQAEFSSARLIEVAGESRPDIRAQVFAMQAAAARAGWEKAQVAQLTLAADIQWNQTEGGVRVGAAAEVPIFNQNQGGVGRAEADIEIARQRLIATRLQVAYDVLSAVETLQQTRSSLRRYARDVIPPLDGALEAARQRYELGDDTYLVVLDALRRLGRARLRHAELEAEAHRAYADLERAMGVRLERTTARGAH